MKYLLIGLIILLVNGHAFLEQSHLCTHRRVYSRRCNNQLRTNNTYCQAEIIRNNTRCEKWEFNSNYYPHDEDRHMRLKSYCFDDGHYILRALNITFRTGNWSQGRFRFTILSDTHTVCVNFTVNSTNLINEKLFYDCVWYYKNLENLDILLEYQLSDANEEYISNGRYKMYLPPCALYGSQNEVSNFHTIVYVNQNYLPEITLHIQKMPIIYNITEYRIKMCVVEHTEETILDNNNQSCIVKENLTTSADDDELIVHVVIPEYKVKYFFIVEGKHEDCKDQYCFVARTPSIKMNTDFWVWYITVSIIFGIVVIAILMYLLLKSKLLVKNKIKVLLLHDPVHSFHTDVVKNLASALIMYNIDVLLDVTDIPKSKIKDPLVWYSTAISEVDYVIVVATPSIKPDTDAIFKDLYAIGLRFANEAIKNKSSNLKIINTLPPYCNIDDIPSELQHFKRFKLIKQLSQMARYLQSHKRFNISYLIHNKDIELGKDFNKSLHELNRSINEMKEVSLLKKKYETVLQIVDKAENCESEPQYIYTNRVHNLSLNSSNKQSDTMFDEYINIHRLNLDGESEAPLIQPYSVQSLDL